MFFFFFYFVFLANAQAAALWPGQHADAKKNEKEGNFFWNYFGQFKNFGRKHKIINPTWSPTHVEVEFSKKDEIFIRKLNNFNVSENNDKTKLNKELTTSQKHEIRREITIRSLNYFDKIINKTFTKIDKEQLTSDGDYKYTNVIKIPQKKSLKLNSNKIKKTREKVKTETREDTNNIDVSNQQIQRKILKSDLNKFDEKRVNLLKMKSEIDDKNKDTIITHLCLFALLILFEDDDYEDDDADKQNKQRRRTRYHKNSSTSIYQGKVRISESNMGLNK